MPTPPKTKIVTVGLVFIDTKELIHLFIILLIFRFAPQTASQSSSFVQKSRSIFLNTELHQKHPGGARH